MQLPGCFLGKGLLLCVLLHLVKGDVTSELEDAQKRFFAWRLERVPEFSSYVGNKTFNDRLEDLSIDAMDTQYIWLWEFNNETWNLDRSQMSRQQQYNFDVLRDNINTFDYNEIWRRYGALNPITFLEGFYLDLDYIIDVNSFDSKKDFDNYVSRLEAWPTQIDQMMDRMRESIRIGHTNHNVSVKAVPGQIAGVINTPPQDSTLYKPFGTTLDNLQLPQQDRDTLRTRGLSAMQNLWTALGRLKTFMETTYSPHTRSTYGVGDLPSGANYYRACLKWHLSVDMPPGEVHQKGLQEVERITGLMRQVMTKQGFNGTVSEYYQHLQQDPQFHLSSADEVLQAYRNLIFDRISPKLPQLFKDIPDNQVIVKPLPYDGPFGMYAFGSEDGSRPGTFYVNVMRPDEATTFRMVSLTLHEAVPGHHLQSVYQMASKLPDFRKYIEYNNYYQIPYQFPFYTAYTEGWALYAEYLGEEMGVYANDYELMGRYGDEIFRAARLVVDTGLHYFGWTRNNAILYLREHTSLPLSEAEIEVDRYITWPGQACAYKIGELKIRELRAKAEAALGSKFDIRDFHSLLLTNGAVPLRLLETIVSDYIADRKAQVGGGIIG